MSNREKKKKKHEKSKETKDERFYALRNAAYADLPLARKLIKQDPSIVSAKNSLGETALHFLAVENQLEAVEFLAQHGSDINNQNEFGTSVLVEVAQIGHMEMVDLLLRLRARVDVAAILDQIETMDINEQQRKHVITLLKKHGHITEAI